MLRHAAAPHRLVGAPRRAEGMKCIGAALSLFVKLSIIVRANARDTRAVVRACIPALKPPSSIATSCCSAKHRKTPALKAYRIDSRSKDRRCAPLAGGVPCSRVPAADAVERLVATDAVSTHASESEGGVVLPGPDKMGAGASSAILVRRDVTCAHRSFDGLAEITETGGCTCRACTRQRHMASSPMMDTHDAYTLTTAMRVIERSRAKVMPPRRAASPDPAAAAAATTASTVLRRRAGVEPIKSSAGKLNTTPTGNANASDAHRCWSEQLNSPVFEDSPVKPAIEAYSVAVLRSATANLTSKHATPACGRRARRARMPLQICRPDFTANGASD